MRLTAQNAINILLGLQLLVLAFHLLIIIKVIPYSIAWGGRLQTDEQMYTFECLSIIINFLLVLILLLKGKYIKFKFKEQILNIALWIYFTLFIINTLGNIFAQTNFERSFALLTLMFSLLIWVVLRSSATSSVTIIKTKQK